MNNARTRVEELLEQLKGEDEVMRENSAFLLGELGEEALDLTKDTLKNDRMLGEINALTIPEVRKKVEEGLIKALFDKDSWVRGNAADALGKLKSNGALEPLTTCLSDEDRIVRYSACQALGLIGSKEATASILSLLKDDHWSVRMSAAEALGKIKDPEAIAALKKLKNDENKDVQVVSREAITMISDVVVNKKTEHEKETAVKI
jgi:HEAT repeat protein